MKPYVEQIHQQIRFAEKSWGSFRVVDVEENSLTIKVTLNPGHQMNYHSHEHRDEVWTVIQGTGYAVLDGQTLPVKEGTVLHMPRGCKHTVVAQTELKIMEVQLGSDIDVGDKIKHEILKNSFFDPYADHRSIMWHAQGNPLFSGPSTWCDSSSHYRSRGNQGSSERQAVDLGERT